MRGQILNIEQSVPENTCLTGRFRAAVCYVLYHILKITEGFSSQVHVGVPGRTRTVTAEILADTKSPGRYLRKSQEVLQ